MAKSNVDLVRKQIGDVDLARVLRDEDAWAARLAEIDSFFMDDFEFVVRVPGEPVTGKGFEEFRAGFLDWIEPWETYLPKIEQILDLGDRVVVLGRDRGRIRGTDQEIEGPKGLVLYHFEAGIVARVEYFFDRDEGLRAARMNACDALALRTTSMRLAGSRSGCCSLAGASVIRRDAHHSRRPSNPGRHALDDDTPALRRRRGSTGTSSLPRR